MEPMDVDPVMKFMKPASQEARTLENLVLDSLDQYCPNWKNYGDPHSYIIPPTFYFKNPHVSDEVTEDLRARRPNLQPQERGIVTYREGDKAERAAYDVLSQLAQEPDFAPFIAFHNVEIQVQARTNGNGRQPVDGRLVKMFRNFNWQHFQNLVRNARRDPACSGACEFDYILVGPKIGIVVIEVKSSTFAKMDEFEKHYRNAIGQLHAFEAVRYLISTCGTVEIPSNRIRKILFCPNLEKSRYEDGIKNIAGSSSDSAIQSVTHLFKEDCQNCGEKSSKPSFFSQFKRILEQFQEEQPPLWYEVCAPFIASIASVAVLEFPRERRTRKRCTADADADAEEMQKLFSASKATETENRRISSQNPHHSHSKRRKLGSQPSCSPLVLASETGKENSQGFNVLEIVFLSPDQQVAMKKGNQHFLIGPAGTGKTILLQAKALDSVRNQIRVLVIATESNLPRWKDLFTNKKYENLHKTVTLRDFVNESRDLLNNYNQLRKFLIQRCSDQESRTNRFENGSDWRWLFAIYDYVREGRDTPLHIFMDDVFGDEKVDCNDALLVPLFLMQQFQFPVWAAFDPNQISAGAYLKDCTISYVSSEMKWLFQTAVDRQDVEVSVLHEVMRCGEEVFNAAYKDSGLVWPRNNFKLIPFTSLEPVLGHKVIGMRVSPREVSCRTYECSLDRFRSSVEAAISQLFERGLNMRCAVILTGSFTALRYNHKQKVIRVMKELFPQHDVTTIGQIRSDGERAINVAYWSEVYSLEWPIVIHACFLFCNRPFVHGEGRPYEQYVARTRATTALIDITLQIAEG